jgi:pSer/pThr/pTyr-binding forkhead associated (FHA) protein
MVVTISIRSSGAAVPTISLDVPRIVIGRSRGSDVRVPDPSVSARHATIRQRGAEYLLLDEGSTNGTFIDGHRLSPGSPVLLGRTTSVRIGRVWMDISLEQAAPSDHPAKLTRDIALGLIAGACEASGNPCAPKLVVSSGPAAGTELVLAELKRVYTIGRGTEADLDLRDDDVSRRHLEVTRRGADVLVRDAGSKNGGTLDGVALAPRKPATLNPRQLLRVGGSELELVDPLTEILKQLEEEPDEVMAEEEHQSSKAPNPKVDIRAEEAPEEDSEADEIGPGKFNGGITTPAKNRNAKKVGKTGWTLTDVLVASLSLAVLGASVAGIAWLFST